MIASPQDPRRRTTVGGLMASDLLARWQPEIVAGHSALDREVRWVHVAEAVDVGVMLLGGELVLTTGVLLTSPQVQARYVEWLDSGSAAGLVLGLGRAFQSAPAALRDAAHRNRLPFVVLHRPTPFSPLVEQIQARILGDRHAEAEISDQLHTRLIAALLRGAGLSELLDEVAVIAGCPVIVENLAGRVLASAGDAQSTTDVLRDWHRLSRQLSDAEAGSRTAFESEPCVAVPLEDLRTGRWGRLVLAGYTGSSRLGLLIADRAGQLLALQQTTAGRERDPSSADDLLNALAAGTARPESLTVFARAAGLPVLRRSLLPLVLCAPEHVKVVALHRAVAALVQAFATRGGVALYGTVGPTTSMLVSLPANASPNVVDDVVDGWRKQLEDPDHQPPLVIAGYPCRSITELQGSFAEAARVVDAVTSHSEPRWAGVVRFGDVRLGGLVRMLRDQPGMDDFIDRTMAPIADRPDLLELLRAFIAAGGNKSLTAHSQHLSRASVYRKLDELSALLGTDLQDRDQLTAIHLALTAFELRHGPAASGG